MTVHRADVLQFSTPSDWINTTVARFSPTPAVPTPVKSITVQRDPLRPAEELSTHADRAMAQIARTASKFDLLEKREMAVDGRPCVYVRFRFTREVDAAIEQGIAFVEPRGDAARLVTILSYAALAAEAADAREVFERALPTVRFRSEPA
jgi:hypothetical protein